MKLNFNPSEYAARPGKKGGKTSKFTPAPEGRYALECIDVSIVMSKNGHKMIKAEHEILNPPANAGHVWDYFLLEHDDPENVRIARERFADWAVAAGKPDIHDSDELEHTQCRVKLSIEPGDGEYGPSNKIKYYIEPKDSPKPKPTKTDLKDDIPY